jgi:ribA/ribD-fused uncharacterized protein
MIEQFRGEHFFLSNMYPLRYRILVGNTAVTSSEAAYQSSKFLDPTTQRRVALITAEERGMGEKQDSIASKNLAHELIQLGEPLRPNWGNIKLGVMHEAVRRKFIANSDIKELLAATDSEELVEGNTWHDTFWGVDLETGEGENNLGKILMAIRQDVLAGKFQ